MNHPLALLALLLLATAPPAAADPLRLVFDTDISGDVDDVLALAMCHALADRGECELLAVTISKLNPLTGPFTDAINTFYGRPDTPIGITRDAQRRGSRFLPLVQRRRNGAPRYPHDLADNRDAPEAVGLLRRTLAAQPDRSVTIVQVGLAVNIARLLDSPPDDHSPLAGVELVRRKVRLLSVMAGAFQTIGADNHFREANVRNDIPSMQGLAAHWPGEVPVVWSGFEIGTAIPYPRESVARDFGYLDDHPVREAYLLHCGPHHDRPTWDLTSVLHAVRPDRGYFELSAPGRVSFGDDGSTRFQPAADGAGRDRFLILRNAAQAAMAREALVQLVTQNPSKP
jgi:hypothetical protein